MSSVAGSSRRLTLTIPQSPTDADLPLKDMSEELEEIDSNPAGRGGYSDVYRYRARANSSSAGTNTVYAVKSLKYCTHDEDEVREKRLVKKFEREIGVWVSLAHQNVLRLHGLLYRHGNPIPCLVSDFMENGTARVYFRKNPQARLISFIRGMAAGIAYLHWKNVVHGDIKSDNVLVTRAGDACLGDFGLSRIVKLDGTATATTTDGNRATRWTAAEYLDFEKGPQHPTKGSDVWSFGCTILELLSGELPYYNIKSDAQVLLGISKGDVPRFPPSLLRKEYERYREGISALCALCWIRDPIHRPSIDTLGSLVNSFCLKGGTCDGLPDNSEVLYDSAVNGHEGIHTRSSSLSATATDILDDENPWIHVESPYGSTDSDNSAPPVNLDDAETTTSLNEMNGNIHLTEHLPQSDVPSPPLPSVAEPITPRASTGSDATILSPGDLTLWINMPSPPPPTVETVLNRLSLSAQQVLQIYFFGRGESRILTYKDEVPTGASNVPTHITCSIGGEVYSRAEVIGKKKHAKEMAALLALKRMHSEDPSRFPRLRYSPVFRSHLGKQNGFKWDLGVDLLDDKRTWYYKTTLKCNDIVLAEGSGLTREDADEEAARNAVRNWHFVNNEG